MQTVVLAHSAVVLRLVNIDFAPTGAKLPTADAFNPSSDEKADAIRLKLPVRVSVWDLARTTVAQAVAMRAQTAKANRAFSLPVQHVVRVSEEFNHPALRVVEDREGGPPVEMPGAEGHCGIEGLRPDGMSRILVRDMKSKLAAGCQEERL